MNLTIRVVDPSLPVPQYQTGGSVAFDLMARVTTKVQPWKPTVIPLNVVVKTPEGYMLLLVSRSSTPMRKGFMITNGVGIIDQDYCGDKDEIGLQVLNFTGKPVMIEKGERIAQAILVKIVKAEKIKVVKTMNTKSRGGFGSTG